MTRQELIDEYISFGGNKYAIKNLNKKELLSHIKTMKKLSFFKTEEGQRLAKIAKDEINLVNDSFKLKTNNVKNELEKLIQLYMGEEYIIQRLNSYSISIGRKDDKFIDFTINTGYDIFDKIFTSDIGISVPNFSNKSIHNEKYMSLYIGLGRLIKCKDEWIDICISNILSFIKIENETNKHISRYDNFLKNDDCYKF